MVNVSLEAPAEAEARLRRLFPDTHIDWLRGTWTLDAEAEPRAMAIVSGAGNSSWLRRTSGADADAMRLFRARFPIDCDTSGFVGWLAGLIKARTGSGVVVICGYDEALGGIFDYWGVPVRVGPQVRRLLAGLAGGGRPDSLDGLVMRVAEPARGAEIDSRTVFCFDQRGQIVQARYGGGSIAEGWLVGRRSRDRIDFRYAQLSVSGRISSGRSRADLVKGQNGRRQLVEHFQWDGGGSGTNLLEEVA